MKLDAESAESNEEGDRKYKAPALEKGLDILELLARRGRPMTLSELAAALDRSASELFRMVQVLEFRHYIEPAPEGDGYQLTNRLFSLGLAQAPTRTLLEAALPEMRRLSDSINQSCHLSVASRNQIVVIARVESPGDLGFSIRVGYRRNITAATSGLVLYAFHASAERAAWRARLADIATPQELDALEQKAQAVRQQGYACSDSDFVRGVTDYSVPIRIGERVIAVLAVPFVQRVDAPCSPDLALQHLLQSAQQIAAESVVGAGS